MKDETSMVETFHQTSYILRHKISRKYLTGLLGDHGGYPDFTLDIWGASLFGKEYISILANEYREFDIIPVVKTLTVYDGVEPPKLI